MDGLDGRDGLLLDDEGDVYDGGIWTKTVDAPGRTSRCWGGRRTPGAEWSLCMYIYVLLTGRNVPQKRLSN